MLFENEKFLFFEKRKMFRFLCEQQHVYPELHIGVFIEWENHRYYKSLKYKDVAIGDDHDNKYKQYYNFLENYMKNNGVFPNREEFRRSQIYNYVAFFKNLYRRNKSLFLRLYLVSYMLYQMLESGRMNMIELQNRCDNRHK